MRRMAWLLVVVGLAGPAQAQGPAMSPEARATMRAQMQELRQKDPVAFATVRAAHRAARQAEKPDNPPRGIEVRGPLPLPVVASLGGAPLGGACPAGKACTLKADAPAGKAIVVTAVWGAATVRCDGVDLATPPGGAPIAPWWRCERDLVLEGAGAGYAAFAAAR